MVRRLGCIGLLMLSAIMALADNLQLPLVEANDNRTPAGRLNHDALVLRLELRQGRWFPEEDNGPYRDIYTFAEEGRAAQTPGPLIRVPSGTTIHATVRNQLPSTATVFGLHQHPGNPRNHSRCSRAKCAKFSLSPVSQAPICIGRPRQTVQWSGEKRRKPCSPEHS